MQLLLQEKQTLTTNFQKYQNYSLILLRKKEDAVQRISSSNSECSSKPTSPTFSRAPDNNLSFEKAPKLSVSDSICVSTATTSVISSSSPTSATVVVDKAVKLTEGINKNSTNFSSIHVDKLAYPLNSLTVKLTRTSVGDHTINKVSTLVDVKSENTKIDDKKSSVVVVPDKLRTNLVQSSDCSTTNVTTGSGVLTSCVKSNLSEVGHHQQSKKQKVEDIHKSDGSTSDVNDNELIAKGKKKIRSLMTCVSLLLFLGILLMLLMVLHILLLE